MNSDMFFNQPIGTFLQDNFYWILLVVAWTLLWKALALWKTARAGDKVWFGIFMVINTAGLLEIIYIFYFSKQPGLLKSTHKQLNT